MICNKSLCDNPVRNVMRHGSAVALKICDVHLSEKMRLAGSARRRPDKYIDKDGYVQIWLDGRRIGEHRAVMQRKIGRKLNRNESVHHINGIRTDNRPENLELWLGGIRYGQRASDIICPHCHTPYSI